MLSCSVGLPIRDLRIVSGCYFSWMLPWIEQIKKVCIWASLCRVQVLWIFNLELKHITQGLLSVVKSVVFSVSFPHCTALVKLNLELCWPLLLLVLVAIMQPLVFSKLIVWLFLAGCTPLHWAAIRGNLEACTVLVQAGTLEDLMAKESTGCTPAKLASDKGHRHVALFLVRNACWTRWTFESMLYSCFMSNNCR